MDISTTQRLEFLTGKLAAPALREVLRGQFPESSNSYTVTVLPITVAALMTPSWIARNWRPAPDVDRVILPGYCEGDLSELRSMAPIILDRGPRDLRRLPDFLTGRNETPSDFGAFRIEILAEINHAPRLNRSELLDQARRFAANGADWIDIGCEVDGNWSQVGDAVKAIRDLGLRVSIDSFDVNEVSTAVRAGAELVLSVNQTNRHAAPDWGVEVVVIPDEIRSLGGLRDNIEWLESRSVRFRVDPILEPIGCGFAASLERYLTVRKNWPTLPMLMGIGNLSELSDVDSAGVNLLLLGFCEELRIDRVLTTEVINWARSSVRECDLARRLVHYAVHHGIPPKNLATSLVMLRDARIESYADAQLEQLAAGIRDHNYRLFAERGEIHLLSANLHLHHADAFEVFRQLMETGPKNVDASHAFYLGYEMAKAMTALTLHKNYRQDEALEWGHLTIAENRHRLASAVPRRFDNSSCESTEAPTDLE